MNQFTGQLPIISPNLDYETAIGIQRLLQEKFPSTSFRVANDDIVGRAMTYTIFATGENQSEVTASQYIAIGWLAAREKYTKRHHGR